MNVGWGFEPFQRLTGFDLRAEWRAEIAELLSHEYASITPDRFHLTSTGLRYADYAAELFLR
jgi:hypothetical protein